MVFNFGALFIFFNSEVVFNFDVVFIIFKFEIIFNFEVVSNLWVTLISEVVFSLSLEVLEAIRLGTFCAMPPSSSSIAEAEAA